MNVNLVSPILITLNSAKLVVEDSGQGTIEFTLFDQPVRLNIASTNYTYDTNIAIGEYYYDFKFVDGAYRETFLRGKMVIIPSIRIA